MGSSNPVKRGKRVDRIDVRIDERTRETLERLKKDYGFKGDADAIRFLIAIAASRENIVAEVEGRVLALLRPYFEEWIREYGNTEVCKERVRALIDEILHDEVDAIDSFCASPVEGEGWGVCEPGGEYDAYLRKQIARQIADLLDEMKAAILREGG